MSSLNQNQNHHPSNQNQNHHPSNQNQNQNQNHHPSNHDHQIHLALKNANLTKKDLDLKKLEIIDLLNSSNSTPLFSSSSDSSSSDSSSDSSASHSSSDSSASPPSSSSLLSSASLSNSISNSNSSKSKSSNFNSNLNLLKNHKKNHLKFIHSKPTLDSIIERNSIKKKLKENSNYHQHQNLSLSNHFNKSFQIDSINSIQSSSSFNHFINHLNDLSSSPSSSSSHKSSLSSKASIKSASSYSSIKSSASSIKSFKSNQSIINLKSNSSNSNSKLKQILNSSHHHSKTSINSNQNLNLNMNISSSQNQSHLLTQNSFNLNNNSNHNKKSLSLSLSSFNQSSNQIFKLANPSIKPSSSSSIRQSNLNSNHTQTNSKLNSSLNPQIKLQHHPSSKSSIQTHATISNSKLICNQSNSQINSSSSSHSPSILNSSPTKTSIINLTPSNPSNHPTQSITQNELEKPTYSYAALIGQAIMSSSNNMMCLNDIYHFISQNYPYYKKHESGWQNSIRHNLSLNKSFIKVPRAPNQPGKGSFWSIAPGTEEQFIDGGFKKKTKSSSSNSKLNLLDKVSNKSKETEINTINQKNLSNNLNLKRKRSFKDQINQIRHETKTLDLSKPNPIHSLPPTSSISPTLMNGGLNQKNLNLKIKTNHQALIEQNDSVFQQINQKSIQIDSKNQIKRFKLSALPPMKNGKIQNWWLDRSDSEELESLTLAPLRTENILQKPIGDRKLSSSSSSSSSNRVISPVRLTSITDILTTPRSSSLKLTPLKSNELKLPFKNTPRSMTSPILTSFPSMLPNKILRKSQKVDDHPSNWFETSFEKIKLISSPNPELSTSSNSFKLINDQIKN
ncbi:hypothetical protein O181_018229 [Austropuccinia psidii MF-1]|uniref:Fork-head domain-containing protein n=1 Tax=Austropuccinia psidii MF-1 TaxID=1389203 RepID=A0A9Q3C4W8_9BASI|nr:hypothetical protein [Austropuccinia psidii MF-1]